MFNSSDRSRMATGMPVFSAEGEQLGKVQAVDDEGIIIEKGLFFHQDYRAEFDKVDAIRDDKVYLKRDAHLPSREAAEQGANAPGFINKDATTHVTIDSDVISKDDFSLERSREDRKQAV